MEYLATGRPMVAAPNPEIETISQMARIARTHESFLRDIEEPLAPPGSSHARIAAVADYSWDRPVENVLDVVARRLATRTSETKQTK